MTRQRKIILEILRSTRIHPTAEWVYEQARKRLPEISLGTVYRNLHLLEAEGEIMELNCGGAFSRYDGKPLNHAHFKCQECDRVFDVTSPFEFNEGQGPVELEGHMASSYQLVFYGMCRHCLNKNAGGLE
jgi:Fur family ferric uptake transcriptional regulator/Fur family peroxide stress response transcriptional regulator